MTTTILALLAGWSAAIIVGAMCGIARIKNLITAKWSIIISGVLGGLVTGLVYTTIKRWMS